MDEFQKLPIVRIRRPDPYSEIQELQPDPANGGGFQVTEKGAAFFLKDALLSAQHLYLPSRARRVMETVSISSLDPVT